MKYIISIGCIVTTLLGWIVTYDIFGGWFPDQQDGTNPEYWAFFDICKSSALFLCAMWPFAGPLTAKWRHIAIILSIYFALNLTGDILRVNEKGNWFTYFTGSIFIYLIAVTTLPKWAYSYLSTNFPRLYK